MTVSWAAVAWGSKMEERSGATAGARQCGAKAAAGHDIDALGSRFAPPHASSRWEAWGSQMEAPGMDEEEWACGDEVKVQFDHNSSSKVVRAFEELRHLHIKLPIGELGISDGVLLKWKADFGSTLGSCVILGSLKNLGASLSCSTRMVGDTNGGLKLRVVWMITSLIVASGVLTMDNKQLQELRVSPASASGSSHRTLMLALCVRHVAVDGPRWRVARRRVPLHCGNRGALEGWEGQ